MERRGSSCALANADKQNSQHINFTHEVVAQIIIASDVVVLVASIDDYNDDDAVEHFERFKHKSIWQLISGVYSKVLCTWNFEDSVQLQTAKTIFCFWRHL